MDIDMILGPILRTGLGWWNRTKWKYRLVLEIHGKIWW